MENENRSAVNCIPTSITAKLRWFQNWILIAVKMFDIKNIDIIKDFKIFVMEIIFRFIYLFIIIIIL